MKLRYPYLGESSAPRRASQMTPVQTAAALAVALVIALPSCSDDDGSNNNMNNNTTPRCGDDVRQGIEACDGEDLGAQTCQSLGFEDGSLACHANCSLDTSGCGAPVTCGDGQIQSPEQCDGVNLNGQSCQALGFTGGGTLTCEDNCTFDSSQCEIGPVCGDGSVDHTAGEECDGANLDGQTCEGLGYAGGTLSCDGQCQLVRDQCIPADTCGNGSFDPGQEDCEGSELGGQTCQSQGFDGGTLTCRTDCTFDTSACHECGNGQIEAAEECDGLTLPGGATCQTEAGFPDGSLACTAGCTLDTSGCHDCGNGQLEGPEVCDTSNVGSETCQSQASLAEGALACATTCLAFDTSDCHDCGNGTREGSEACDIADFGSATCTSETGLVDGSLSCTSVCTIEASDCHTCGNTQLEGPELCDDTNLNGETCQSQAGAADGQLLCAVDCLGFDTSDCHECGNGVVEGGEECDGDVFTDSCISLGYGTGAIGCNSSCLLDTTNCVTCTWQWDPISTGSGAPQATEHHAAVWMPQYGKMYVHGGVPAHYTWASLYDPVADDWEATVNIAATADFPTVVWTGTEIIEWFGSGRRYNPSTTSGAVLGSDPDEPTVSSSHTAVWTGTEMIVWGGGSGTNYGARYNPTTDTWTPTSQGTNSPTPRMNHGAVWTGTRMIIWGGGVNSGLDTGGVYNPVSDSWSPTSISGLCPDSRTNIRSAVVWTGSEMFVWGGTHGFTVDSGASYDPGSNTWQPSSSVGAPSPRTTHTVVWTGSESIVWGGWNENPPTAGTHLNDGAHYDPITDTWRTVASAGAPSVRRHHSAVWTGNEMIVWGGSYEQGGTTYYLNDGAWYWCNPN